MKTRVLAAVAGLSLLLAACGGGEDDGAATEPAASAEPRTLTVLAAASLTDVFAEIESRFEADNPGVDVVYNFGASSDLAQQVVNGAPADVFAAANTSTMTTVSDAGLTAGEPTIFTTNVLEIVTAPGNPKGVTGFADLARPDITLVVCAPQVPCGSATEKVEQATGVTLSPASEEPDVRSTLAKVTTGNADAGLVYATDVASAGDSVTGVPFPEADQAVNEYPVAVLSDAPQPELATRFRDLVTGPVGQEALAAAGFGTP
ncbi:MAG TPA: molybdate ABC transporter substrate-binding protein [Pseudonocardia sp.]|nr:molybdate ABC transporter substrate-binding protein [Pseudonocardia sp.]